MHIMKWGNVKPLVIGIAGKSGSGKTTVAMEIAAAITNGEIASVRFDDYYKNQDYLSMEERVKTNYDHPHAFDWDLLVDQLTDLINLKPINKPLYDYTNHTRSSEIEVVNPAKVIILEGIFCLLEPELRNLLDIKIFVDTDDDECIIRRILRDTKERGRSLDSVIDQYLSNVKPMSQQFIEPTKKYADFIIPRGGGNKIAIDLIKSHIQSYIKE